MILEQHRGYKPRRTEQEDQYTHRYIYDENNRLTDVKTSAVETGESSHDHINPSQDWHLWDNEASYEYYDHGPLARTVIGEDKLQGCDYAYTLQGWVKGVNSSLVNPKLDMGTDGTSNSSTAEDAYGYTIGYFENDYQPIVESRNFETNYTDTHFSQQAPSLYNGNIRNMVVDIKALNQPIGYTYNYDQLHRIKSMDSHKNIDISNNSWVSIGDEDEAFKTSYAYDANGNITNLDRNGSTGAEDVLRYTYDKNSNRLNRVIDRVSPNFSSTPGYISNHSRYSYDGAGNLIRERNGTSPFDDIANINWTPYGKVNTIITPDGETIFGYGPDQNRISKKNIIEITSTANPCTETRYTFGAFQQLGSVLGFDPYQVNIAGLLIDGVNVMRPDENGATTITITSGDGFILNMNNLTDFSWSIDSEGNPYFKEFEGGFNLDSSSSIVLKTGFLGLNNGFIGSSFPLIDEVELPCGQQNSEFVESSTYYIRDAQGNVMGVYEVKDEEITWKEQHIYGSSRLGMLEPNVTLKQENTIPYYENLGVVSEGQKRYELSNHLGNVLAVINDRKQKVTELNSEIYRPTVISAQDYFPFGQEMGSDRSFSASESYRYGFNGKEKDSDGEWGNSTHYDYGFRIYNPSIGKFLSQDPKQNKYPSISPYAYTLNNPLIYDDPMGDTVRVTITNKSVGYTQIRLHSGPEIEKNAKLANLKVWVPVYRVDLTNDSGDAGTYFFTRYAERQKGTSSTGSIKDVTFDVRNPIDNFAGEIKSRWGKKNNVLEIRPLDDVENQTVSAMIGYQFFERTAIQLHALGASDGCMMCVNPDNIESPFDNVPNYSGSATQVDFMDQLMNFQINDVSEGLSDFIKISVERVGWYTEEHVEDETLELFRIDKENN